MLKGWLDPVTAAKIEILDNTDIANTLSSYIELRNVPKQFGGEFEFEHGMLPKPDEDIQKVLDVALPAGLSSLAGPFKWVVDGSGRRMVVPVGTIDGRTRESIVGEIIDA